MENVVITGVGLFVPQQINALDLFNTLYEGNSLLNEEALVPGSAVKTLCGRINDDQMQSLLAVYPELDQPHLAKSSKMAIYAADKALQQANIQPDLYAERLGLFVGCNKNFPQPQAIHKLWQAWKGQRPTETELTALKQDLHSLKPHQAAEVVAKHLGVQGPVFTHGDACVAGAAAIVGGYRRIRHGELDIALCGGSEYATQALMQLVMGKVGAGCQSTFDPPTAASRPFDQDRAGCLLSDAAAFLVLESEQHAQARGAKILAHLSGAHRESEAHKVTSTKQDGSLYRHCIEQTFADSKITPEQIDHINAHGTSTVSNDRAESQAIASCYPQQPFVTSTKSALGHSLATSGVVEAILCTLSLQEQKLLPTINFCQQPENEAKINIVTQGQPAVLNHIVSHSFGFGGENACLIFSQAS